MYTFPKPRTMQHLTEGTEPLFPSADTRERIPENATINPSGFGDNENNTNMPGSLSTDEEIKVEGNTEDGWTFLLNTAREYDHGKIDGWKDDLNNLLVFAALFSAIVTAFTIESYQWLQEDPADTSVQLLAQISLQLSSFTAGQGFVNSTTGTLPPSPPFKPEKNDVTINMLWFLSLTLSLLASFFTLAVQQWLRAYILPKNLSVRDAVRLRQSRHEAFILWQVPNIIMFLPVVLQGSVILFLVGVYYLLQSLNHPITTAFAVVSAGPFCSYAVSLVLPLIWPSCPFKSPLVPATVVVLNWCLIPVAGLAFVFVCIPFMVAGWLTRRIFRRCSERRDLDATMEVFMHAVMSLYTFVVSMLQTWFSLAMSIFVHMNEFWTAREVRELAHDDEDTRTDCDEYALEWAVSEVSVSKLSILKPCLADLPGKKRTACVLNWLAVSSGDTTESVYALSRIWCPVDPIFLNRLSHTLVHQYKDYLLDALPEDWTSCDRLHEDDSVAAILVILTRLVKTSHVDEEFASAFVKLLFKVWASQRIEDIKLSESIETDSVFDWDHVPAVSLFQCWDRKSFKLTIPETVELVSSTTTRISELLKLDSALTYQFVMPELCFAASAISLLAVREQLQTISTEDCTVLDTKVHQLLTVLDQFISAERRGIRFVVDTCRKHPKMSYMLVTHQVHTNIVDSLLSLAEAGAFPLASNTNSYPALIRHLHGACVDQPELQAVLTSLSVSHQTQRRSYTLLPGVAQNPRHDVAVPSKISTSALDDLGDLDRIGDVVSSDSNVKDTS